MSATWMNFMSFDLSAVSNGVKIFQRNPGAAAASETAAIRAGSSVRRDSAAAQIKGHEKS